MRNTGLMEGGGNYALTESQEALDEAGLEASPNSHSKNSTHHHSTGFFNFNLQLRERLFLFAFDLIELNQFYNYLIYSIFTIIEFIFLVYYPLNQMYADFVIPVLTSKAKDTKIGGQTITYNGLGLDDNLTASGNNTLGEVISVISNAYVNLKKTGLYQEEVRYEKRFHGENRDSVVTQILSYINLDYILDNLDFERFNAVQQYFCHGFIAFYVLLAMMIITRQPGTINLSGQRRFITKLFSFAIITLVKTVQMPLITFILKIFSCSNEEIYFDSVQAEVNLIDARMAAGVSSQSASNSGGGGQNQNTINTVYQEYCYQGSHLNQVVYSSIVLFLYFTIVAFFHCFLTLSYPHEKLPWACLPTKIPFLRELTKFFIVFAYQETNISRNGLSYLNIVFTLLWLFIIYKRINHVLIFHTTVYLITIIGESTFFVIFFYTSLRDFVSIDRNFILHALLVFSCAFTSYTVVLLREKVRQKSLCRVDFAIYEKDFDALIMMFTLHELIERSGYEESQDFLLRGFIERHIEICEFPQCSCIKYFQITNQTNRIDLAQQSPYSRAYDSNQITSNANLQGMNTRGGAGSPSMVFSQGTSVIMGGGAKEQSDGDELSTMKNYFGGKNSQQKINKKKSKFLKKFLIDNINVFLEIFPGSVKLHIMAAFIYFSLFKNSFKSLYELSFTRSKKSSLQDKYECFVLSSQVIAYFQSRASQGMSNQPVQFEKATQVGTNGSDDKKKKAGEFNSASFEVQSEIKSVIEFEKINIQFQKMIEKTSILTRKFWQEILKKNIDVGKVFGLGARIYKNFVKIKRQYKHLMQLNNNYLEVAYLYKLFVSLILNFEIEVEDAKLEIVKIMQSKSMRKHNLKAEYKTIQLLEENGMIIISGSTSNFGKILAMNNKAERTFGYGTNELMGNKLNRLMPRLLADRHEDLILNFVNGNRRINKENHNFVWGKHKNNFIFPLIMEINAYVNFEFNFCFIAFLKRSILLEFQPLRELLEYSEVFVMQISNEGVIEDMTQNMSDYLNFPIQALQKDININLFFKGVDDLDSDQNWQGGRKILDFDPTLFRRVLEQEDIDIRNENEIDFLSNINMTEKKCASYVWLRTYDYNEQDIKLSYKEVWFILIEQDEQSNMQSNFTTEGVTHGEERDNVKINMTYTDDREEICSIASMSSLANYDKNRKNIMAKLSEIKTQTIDDQKPRQIDLLQKAIILVFLSVISIALLLLIVSTDRNTGFFSNLDIIHYSKNAAIYFSVIRLKLSSIVYYSNSKFNYSNDTMLYGFTDEILSSAREDLEELRKIQSYLNFVKFDYSEKTLEKKKQMVSDYLQIRSRHIIESQADTISMIQGIQQFLDVSNDITSVQGKSTANGTIYNDFIFNTSILNYDNTNSSQYQGQQIGQTAINFYQLLKNGHASMGNYLLEMSENYIDDAIYQANNNSSLVLILTVVSIAITFLTAFIILPILHKIERSKEKVLMIYTELKKEQIESLNRNIIVFFMKLQSGANQVSGTLSYGNSARQFSNKFMTRKFTMNPNNPGNSGAMDQGVDEFGMLGRGTSMAQIDLSGGNDMLRGGGGNMGKGKESGSSGDPFSLLMPGKSSGDTTPRHKGGRGKKVSIFNKNQQQMNSKSGTSSRALSKSSKADDHSEYESDDDHSRRPAKKHGHRKNPDDSDEALSDNAEEDKRAQILMSKEEAENALFKRLFQNKIKQMTCIRQVKYYSLVAIISLLMSGYFTLSYFMVTQIFKDSQSSLEIFNTVGNRGPYLDSLLSFFIQTQIRNQEPFVPELDDNIEGSPLNVNSIDYYYNLTQINENSYSYLRRAPPSMIAGSASLIDGLESKEMCFSLIDDEYVKLVNKHLNETDKYGSRITMDRTQLIDQCKLVANRLLQLGLQQTISSILQSVLQGTLQFREGSQAQSGGQLKQDKESHLFSTILVKNRYLNRMDQQLLTNVKQSILSYFQKQQKNYIIVFSVFFALVVISMILLSYYGVEYLFKNLIAIKFILNFIPGQWLIENNAADDLKYVEF